ncbi:hypothetical protein H4Q26_018033 [Puccinia striiformis f. sp. tritici PST-130]|nr:hypothetical protein H4Q26_018033 [Puccinia striiformis f. sp. tritici PST-130]
MDDRYGYRADYPLFKLPSPLSSQSDYFDEGLDDGSLNDLVDTVDRNHKYPSNQYQELPSQGNDQQFTSSPDRDYIPAPQARRNSSNRIHSTEFQDRYDSPCIYPAPHILLLASIQMTPSWTKIIRRAMTSPSGITIVKFRTNLFQINPRYRFARTSSSFVRIHSLQQRAERMFPDSLSHKSQRFDNAPTGSGKTVLFELAILRMLEYNQSSKAVYMAPTNMTGDGLSSRNSLNNLRLVCIDEVSHAHEERGSVLEVIVARMKTLGTSPSDLDSKDFATVPNISDVAEWLGDGGVADQNQKALPGQAPAKTFISLQAAEALSKAYQKMSTQGDDLPWEAPRSAGTFSDKKLTELGSQGIGIHHAGLDHSDRRQVESLLHRTKYPSCVPPQPSPSVLIFQRGVSLSAVPRTYRGGAPVETDSKIIVTGLDQMMGRAGRPQFDDEGVAVVMTSQNDKMRIEKLVKSETMLESCLHLNLTEHINSEIYMGTITSRSSAIAWLKIHFSLKREAFSISDDQIAPDKQLANFAEAALDLLAQDGLIEEDEDI